MQAIESPLTGVENTKKELGVFVVTIITVVAIMLFSRVLTTAQQAYVEVFDGATVDMADFTIRVMNLPHHKYYGD